jgi:tetratricopeptide (TPR) repeat protein
MLAMGEWERAIPYFQQLLDKPLYRTPYLAYNNIGWAHYNLTRYDEAIKQYKMAIFMNPKFCLGHNNLGRVRAHLGDTNEALDAFGKAIELCPKYAEPHYFMGRIYLALNAANEAMKHFQTCQKLGPDSPYGKKCTEAL